MSLEKMKTKKVLKDHQPSQTDISRRLIDADENLLDAKNITVSKGTRLLSSYDVILVCSDIALRASGFRIRIQSGNYHERLISTLFYTLGQSEKMVRYYQKLRKKRHEKMYESILSISDSELEKAINESEELLKKTKSWLEANHPHLINPELKI